MGYKYTLHTLTSLHHGVHACEHTFSWLEDSQIERII